MWPSVRMVVLAAALLVNPPRPKRYEPRVIKDRHDKYKLMNRPRDQLRKALKCQPKEA